MKENKMLILITNLDKINITNDKTGEVNTYCRITYLIEKESTEKSIGYAQMQSYVKEDAFVQLKGQLLKHLTATYTTVVDKNRFKIKLIKLNDYVLAS